MFNISRLIEFIYKTKNHKREAQVEDYVEWFLKKFGGGGDKWDAFMWAITFVLIIALFIFG